MQADKLEPISEEELARAMPKRRVGFKVWAVVSFVVFVAGPLVAYLSWVASAQHRFEQRLNVLSDMGVPVTAGDIDAMYVVPDDSIDSTPLYVKAMSVLSSEVFESDAEDVYEVGRSLGTPPSPTSDWSGLSEAKRLLEKYKSVSRDLHLAADQGGVAAYPLRFEDGFGTPLEHAQNLRLCVRFLALEAHVRAREGDAEGTTRAIVSALAASRSLQAEPVIVSQMVYKALIEKNVETIQQLLPHVSFSDSQLARLQASLQSFNVRSGLRNAFKGEQAMLLIALRDGDRDQLAFAGFEGQRLMEAWVLSKLGSRFDDVLLLTECQQQFLEAVEKSWPEAMNEVQHVADETNTATEGPIRERQFQLTRTCLHIPYTPAMPFAAAATAEAKLRMMDALLAAKRFHLARGQLPTELEQLVPEFVEKVPQDPFSPQDPIGFQSHSNIFEVSSVGLEGSVASDLAGRTELDIKDTGEIRMSVTVE